MAQASTLTHSRFGRIAKLGGLATSVAGNVLMEGGRSLFSGSKPSLSNLLVSEKNAQLISSRLSEMRGAAMKIGQLMSMDVGYLIPREVAEIFSRLRNEAHAMPMLQVAAIMQSNFGNDWQNHFQRFKFQPIASASIGQVHEAVLKDGKKVAIKLQYPGVKRSIDSDIDNVAMLLELFNLMPSDLDIKPLLEDAREQLHAETDYQSEAAFAREFAAFVQSDNRFEVAAVFDELTSDSVLTTSYQDGVEIDKIADKDNPTRQAVSHALLELALREVFQFGCVQTDSNFANYLFSEDSGKIQLLDFGATRRYAPLIRDHLSTLLHAGMNNDLAAIRQAAYDVGYMAVGDDENYQQAIADLIHTVTSPLRHEGEFDFKNSDLSQRMVDKLMALRFDQRYTRLPPTDILFLHRKLGGLYLLLSHLGARINVKRLMHDTLLIQ